eukprot:m.44931 g.44931  ORF g.44931 m.44931 type:complete len:177 (+) comp14610_c0_seq1:46-576(+)
MLRLARRLATASSRRPIAPIQQPPVVPSGSTTLPAERERERGRWTPVKKLSRPAMEHLRTLHATDPAVHTREKLAQTFGISVEAVRRILRSKFEPAQETAARQQQRYELQQAERRAQQRLKRRGELPLGDGPKETQRGRPGSSRQSGREQQETQQTQQTRGPRERLPRRGGDDTRR